ncbi:hypothetical protein [Streptomyces beijiangensis]|uniref:Uncharacterized protein n=1 Tax=Streptomyces beijiangensis TaxID=163361 RepID=A0A939FH25_9ACTN|nr:hypothetical protein [Streptomyces beijiangensis]MBO0516975.1 hypothetical protein [Streptomyces beijiangensis]
MTEPEFTATGVRIERWPRSLTRAGKVLIKDGRLALLTSRGQEIDSAPLGSVSAVRPWFAGGDRTVATVNGTRYRLTMGQAEQAERPDRRPDGSGVVGRFLDAVREARGARE